MKKETLAQKAYNIIKEKLIYSEWEFGQEIDQRSLAADLGFNSVTPIREALILLQNENLINVIPRKGMFVSHVSLKDVFDNYQLRQIIEPAVFAVTAKDIPKEVIGKYKKIFNDYLDKLDELNLREYLEIDMDFHIELTKPLNNPSLENILRNIYEQNVRYRMASMRKRVRKNMINEHLKVIEALENEDYKGAVSSLEKHIVQSKNIFGDDIHEFL
jgi:DNA-binding GntR family transcriptional regulator